MTQPKVIPVTEWSDADLEAGLAIRRNERARLSNLNLFDRETAHARVDECCDAAEDALRAALAANVYGLRTRAKVPFVPEAIADAWVTASDPRVRALWHQAVDEATPEWFAASRPVRSAELREITAEINAIRAEQARRRVEAARVKEAAVTSR